MEIEELVYEIFKYAELNIININEFFMEIGQLELIHRKVEWFNEVNGCNYCIACASKCGHLDIVIYFHEKLNIPVNIPSLYLSAMYGNIEVFGYLYKNSKHIFDSYIWSNCIEYSKGRIDSTKMELLNELIE